MGFDKHDIALAAALVNVDVVFYNRHHCHIICSHLLSAGSIITNPRRRQVPQPSQPDQPVKSFLDLLIRLILTTFSNLPTKASDEIVKSILGMVFAIETENHIYFSNWISDMMSYIV